MGMDLSSEKADIIRRFEQINDLSLINAIKNLLDFGLQKQRESDRLNASIDQGLSESRNGETRSHSDVMSDINARYFS
jgi:hypothetical protein